MHTPHTGKVTLLLLFSSFELLLFELNSTFIICITYASPPSHDQCTSRSLPLLLPKS